MALPTERPMLVVEDSPEDFEATIRFFNRTGIANPILRCEDGDDALDFLFRRGPYTDPTTSPRPGLILLDLNLPGLDGRDVLAEIKEDESLRTIPVVVFTSSNLDEDVSSCYRAGANSYLRKPVDLDEFNNTLLKLKEFWLEKALLPPGA